MPCWLCSNMGTIDAMLYINRLGNILLGFRGSINRQAFWISFLVIAMAYMFSPFRPPTVDGYAGALTIASELWNYGWLIPLAAVAVKRVNDIGWPIWLGYAYAAIVGLSFIPWSIGVLPMPPESMSPAISYGISALLLVELVGFTAFAFVPANWRPRRYAEQALPRAAGVAVQPSARQETFPKSSAMLIWGLFISSIITLGLGALAGCIVALVRRRQLAGTPFASHATTAIKVFTYSTFTLLIVAIGVGELMKLPTFASLVADHTFDVGLANFVFALLLVWLPFWGVVGFLRAKNESAFGPP